MLESPFQLLFFSLQKWLNLILISEKEAILERIAPYPPLARSAFHLIDSKNSCPCKTILAPRIMEFSLEFKHSISRLGAGMLCMCLLFRVAYEMADFDT